MNIDIKQKLLLALGIGATSIALVVAYKLYNKSTHRKKTETPLIKNWRAVGTVTALNIFPIKSCQGILVDEAEAQPIGLVKGDLKDRSFVIVHENSFKFLNARTHPSIVLIQTKPVGAGKVELSAPGMEPIDVLFTSSDKNPVTNKVKIFGEEVMSIDCGDQVAQWLSRYIFQKETGARLVFLAYPEVFPRLIEVEPRGPWMHKPDGTVETDYAPFHLLSVESTNDLSSRTDEEISILRFRPNITVSGCKPYEEDGWKVVRIGNDAVFRFVKSCDRCLMTTIDPTTGVRHPDQEPLRTLRKYRQTNDPELRKVVGSSPMMGITLSLDKPGKIRIGDTVYAAQF